MNARTRTTTQVEDKAIAYFKGHLHSYFRLSATIVDTPDRNGVQGGCDFIVSRGGERWAIDVTEVDSYPSQRDEAALALRYKDCIERVAKETQPSVFVHVGLEPSNIPKSLSAACLEAYLKGLLSSLGAGDYDKCYKDTTHGFPIHYWIEDSEGFDPDCFIHAIGGSRGSGSQSQVLSSRIEAKNNQLAKYKSSGCETAVLLDLWDIQGSHPKSAALRFARLLPKLSHFNISEIWLLYSPTEPYRVLPVKLKDWIFRGTDEDVELIRQHMSRRADSC
jgi:hypothetical protein